MMPTAVFAKGRGGKVKWNTDAAAVDETCRAIRALALDEGFALVGANAATEGRAEAFRLDGIHPARGCQAHCAGGLPGVRDATSAGM
jgi:hypothetical protein